MSEDTKPDQAAIRDEEAHKLWERNCSMFEEWAEHATAFELQVIACTAVTPALANTVQRMVASGRCVAGAMVPVVVSVMESHASTVSHLLNVRQSAGPEGNFRARMYSQGRAAFTRFMHDACAVDNALSPFYGHEFDFPADVANEAPSPEPTLAERMGLDATNGAPADAPKIIVPQVPPEALH